MAKLLFLGRLADVAGEAEVELRLADPLDWPAVLSRLEDCFSTALADAVSDARVRVAINGTLLAEREALELGVSDEIAFLPPVSGG